MKINFILFLFTIILFSGCSLKEPLVDGSKKTFENEDMYIMFALRAEEIKDYKSASKLFNLLYKKSHKKEYIYRSLKNNLFAKNTKKVISIADKMLDSDKKDLEILRLKILALIEESKFELAKDEALYLVSKSNAVDDYILVSEVYIKQKKYNIAMKYLESAYTKEYNEKILDKMSVILYVNLQRKKDAIAQLETHTMIYGCSRLICSRLIGFYSNENNIDAILSVYLRMYRLDANEKIAEKIVQIYDYKKEYIKLIDFLEKTHIDDEKLFQTYVSLNKYKKAYILARKIYDRTSNVDYLAQSAIFKYQDSKNKNDKKLYMQVIKDLKKVISKIEKPMYLNYLGYLMIEHSVDIKGGMLYVRKALTSNEESAYFLDSLAWGYYKLHNCKKAKKIMDKVVRLGDLNEKDIIFHLNEINKCIKNKKRGKK